MHRVQLVRKDLLVLKDKLVVLDCQDHRVPLVELV